MIQYSLHGKEYLDVAKHYYNIWETPSVKEDATASIGIHDTNFKRKSATERQNKKRGHTPGSSGILRNATLVLTRIGTHSVVPHAPAMAEPHTWPTRSEVV